MSVAAEARAESPAPTGRWARSRASTISPPTSSTAISKAGRADKPAYIDPRGTWTYGQLADRVARFAAVLRALGVRREERVLIALLDTIDWPTAFLGCLKAGVVAVPVNTLMTEDDYRFMLADSRARVLVVSEALYPRFAKLIGAERRPRARHRLGRQRAGSPSASRILIDGAMAEAADRADRARRHRVLALHLGLDRQAEGRGARPCRPEADRRSLRRAVLGITENDVCYSVAKLFFAYGLGNALTFPMSAGACTVLLPDRPTPDGVAALLRKHPVTVFYAVPTFYAAFLASPNAPQESEMKLRCCVSAGEALPEDVGKRWLERYGVDILDGIGSTEMLHIFLSNRPGEVKYGTTGKPVPGYDLQARRRRRAAGEEGRDGRAPGPRPDQRDDVLEQPRAIAQHLPRRMDPLRATSTSRTSRAISSTAAGATTC